MVLGILIMLFGISIIIDPNSSMMGVEYMIIIIGIVIGIFGFLLND